MKTYLAMINEEKLKKVVASADKSDFVYIFYFSGNDNISLSMFKELSSAKCKVEFVEVSSDTALAFEVGKLSVKHAPFTCLSDNPVLVETSKLSGGIKPVDHIATIFKSVKLMDSEKIEFAEALSRNTNKTTADKLNKALPAVILTSVIDLVSTMDDSI